MEKPYYINMHRLDKVMYYCPSWNHDRHFFIQLLDKSNFADEDILKLGRLYIKYNQIYKQKNNELTNYFDYMLKKMNIYGPANLFNHTKYIYNQKRYFD